MNRRLIFIAMLAPMFAQEQTAPQQQQTPPAADTKAADQTQPDQKPAAAPPASPVPSAESWITGSIDLGYRWRSDVAGSLATYRSLVDLGSGPKLLGTEFTITDPKHRLFDTVRVRAYDWGDDPYETFHLDAIKSKAYDFSADYRDFAYFNYLPSYADPLLARGIALNEQSFDLRRRLGSFQLDLKPSTRFIPYFAYERDSSSGAGATVFVTDANEFPVPSTMRDLTNLYRGGLRIELRRFHATLEQGGTTSTSDQGLFQNPGSTNFGNVNTPILGQTIDLTNLLAAYGERGHSVYSKGLLTANVTSWLDVYGQFLYSQPQTTVNYQQTDAGNLLLQSQLLFYTSQQYLVSATSKLPHTTGNAGAEIRPFRRMRILESWITDRLHNTGSAASNQTFANKSTSEQMSALLASSLVTNYNQEEIDVLYDLTSKIMLRGGYRYVWGNANDAVLPPEGLVSSDTATLRRNVGLGAVTFRPAQKLLLTAEAEGGSSSGAYFRTSLYDYQKVRAQARYQAIKSLSLAADFNYLANQNPVPGVNYDFHSQQESLSLFWSPGGGKFGDLQGSYTRTALLSDIGFLTPQNLQPQTSLYRDNAHTATALFNFKFPYGVKFTGGGSFFISSGSRPTSYFQPIAKLWVPFGKHVAWFSEWRYYDYGEAFYLYEGFRATLVTTGLRFIR